MIKKIIEISQGQCHLSVSLGQLVVKRDGEKKQIPIEDIGVLLVDNQATTYTHCVMTELLANNCAVVLCDGVHHPSGMLFSLSGNTTQTETFGYQINAKEPLKKRLWRQIVVSKIRHQGQVVRHDEKVSAALKGMARRVRSGDPDNLEGQASRKYWPVFVNNVRFRRDRDGEAPNNLLNYGYMVLRAAVARSLCCAGLLPALGIHHCNKYNAYCLADDMIEPFRGFVDEKVRQICDCKKDISELDQETKAALLEVLYEKVNIGGFNGPLMVGLHRTAASLARCYSGEGDKLELPEFD